MSGDPATASGAGGVDPATVHTLSELAEAFQRLRGSRSYTELDRAVNPNHGRQAPRVLAPSTLNNTLRGRSVPTRETVVRLLTACGLDEDAKQPWMAAWERVNSAHLRRPAGAVRVRDTQPRLLGVHASIRVTDAEGELPPYVPRDLDAELRTAVTAAGRNGGLVLLIGGSSVGKTRALHEAVRTVLPEWWLIHPADPTEVAVFASAPTSHTVVWLDELQRYLDDGLNAASVRAVVGAGTLLVATLWPEEYQRRIAARAAGQPDPYANDRQLLGFAHVIDVSEAFSLAERRRAKSLASDRRIRLALDAPDAGVTQTLAAGPQLIRWWENASDLYGRAVITAAMDARRVGATGPLTRDLLRAAAPGYLPHRQQATAPADWLDQALRYATTPLHGAASALVPIPAGMGNIVGYTVADYLYQHARRVRRTAPLPEVVWQALVDHHRPDDAHRLAQSAERRMRLDYAEVLYRQAVDSNRFFIDDLADVLAKQGRVDEAVDLLRPQANVDEPLKDKQIANILIEHGNVENLQSKADADIVYAVGQSGLMHPAWSSLYGLSPWPEHDFQADARRAYFLARRGRLDELSRRAEAGDQHAEIWLTDLLAGQGRLDEAEPLLRAQADAGNPFALLRLADLTAGQDRIDELRTRAEGGSWQARIRLVDLLAGLNHVDDLRAHAEAGETYAAFRLAELLAGQGQADEAIAVMRDKAESGHPHSALRLADQLVGRGKIDEAVAIIRRHAESGYPQAREWLADIFAEEGRIDELRTQVESGDGRYARYRLARLLAEQGEVDGLRALVEAGNEFAAGRLADLLAGQGQIDSLRARAAAGDPYASVRLADLLANQGQVDEALTVLGGRADAGDEKISERLADLLAEQGRIDSLAARAAAGDPYASVRLADLLANQGLVDEAVAVLRANADADDWRVATRLVDVLVNHGRIEDLECEAHAGTKQAAKRLQELRTGRSG